MQTVFNNSVMSCFIAAVLLLPSSFSTAFAAEPLDTSAGQELVQPFYDFLSGKADSSEAFVNMDADWRSFSSDTAFRNIEETTVAIEGLREHVVPDLNWAIHEVIVNNEYVVVRGEGSGTPTAEFFGVPASGKKFSIMSIDIHHMVDGVVVTTWHVENWADAIRQLAAGSR